MRFWFSLGMGFLLCSKLAAIDLVPMEIPELARRAELIVRARVEGKSIRKDGEGRIFTEVKLAVQEVWKGDPKGPLVTLVHGGGTLGEQRDFVTEQVSYAPGEEVVDFLVWNARGEAVTLSLTQGKFHVAGQEVSNPFHGVSEKLGVDELKSKVREALR